MCYPDKTEWRDHVTNNAYESPELDQLRVHLSMSDNTDDNSQNGSEGSSEGTGPILAGQQVSKGARRTRSGSNG